MESGPQSRVSAALTRLAIVCHRPKRIATEEAEMLWFDTMSTAMMDYPLDVVQWAFGEWRKSPEGNWWPAEAELRMLCERAVEDRRIMLAEVEAALSELQARSLALPAPRKYEGRAAEFMSRARKRCNKGQVIGYFSKWTMRIEGDTIWVRGKIHEIRVAEIAGDLADELGFAIKWDSNPKTVWPFYDGPEATDAERAAFIGRLHRLSRALAMPRPKGAMTQDHWATQLRKMSDLAATEEPGDDA